MGRMIKLQKHLNSILKQQIATEDSRKRQSIYSCCIGKPGFKRKKRKSKKNANQKVEIYPMTEESDVENDIDVNLLEDAYLKEERRKEDLGIDDDEAQKELEQQKALIGQHDDGDDKNKKVLSKN